MTDLLDRPRPAETSLSDRAARSFLTSILIALAAAAGLFLVWRTAGTLLLIFAGLLFGVLLDACTRGLALVLPVGRLWRLSIVCVLFALATSWLVIWSGTNLVAQADSLIQLIGEQLRVLRGELRSMGIPPLPSSEGPRTLAQLLFPDPGALFGTAYSAFNLASGVLGSVVLIVFIGLFTAASPETYRRGVLSLIPRERRPRVGKNNHQACRSKILRGRAGLFTSPGLRG